MTTGRKFTHLTLVLSIYVSHSLAWAAPDLKTGTIKTTEGQSVDAPPGVKDMDVTPAPAVDPSKIKTKNESVYFPYESAMSARLGLGTDMKIINDDEYNYFFGLLYQLPGEHGKHWESGVDVLNDGTGMISFSRKWRSTPTEAMRPFYKLGAGLRAIPSEQLATTLKLTNYQIRAGYGFEYFLSHPASARVDFDAWMTMKVIGFQFAVGYSYAW